MIPVQPPNISHPLSPQTVSALRLLGDGDRALLDASVLPLKIPSLVLGEQVRAHIAELLGNDQVAVLIKNALFTLTLPPGLQLRGDTINLRVTSLRPGITFALTDNEPAADHPDASVQVELSSASRYLMRLLSASDQGSGGHAGEGGLSAKADSADNAPSTAGPRNGSASDDSMLKQEGAGNAVVSDKLLASSGSHGVKLPALDAQHEAPVLVAQALKDGVTKSGLFYESHLQSWEQGEMTLTELQQEPQAKIGLQVGQAGHGNLPELGNLVQRQLTALETQQVPLQGLAWPGQPMQMVIQQEETADRQAHGASEAQVWATHLTLDLPVLGGLSARLRLVGNTVQISFTAEEPSAEALIQQNSARLESGLASAGLSLATLSVKHDEEIS